MKFRTPPQWPPVPDGWIPDPGWHPEADWPSAPKDWDFWVNDYGVPVEGPPGLYGARVRRVSWTRRALVGGGALLAFLVGVGMGGAGPTEQQQAAALLEMPTPTVTVTPSPLPTITMPAETVTAPPETVTLPPATVTLPAQTVTVGSEAGTSGGFGIAGGGSGSGSSSGSGSGSGSGNSASVYYANCAAARAAGAAPIRRGEPGYRSGLDRDNDGIACE